MKKLNPHDVGFALGVLAGLWHLTWSVMVATGIAEQFLEFIFGLHFIINPYMLTEFDPVRAIMLILVTAVLGYIAGFVFAVIWNSGRK